MFKKEVAQRAARVMGNVIREPISKKDHELMQSYLKGPRQMSPQVSLKDIILLLYLCHLPLHNFTNRRLLVSVIIDDKSVS